MATVSLKRQGRVICLTITAKRYVSIPPMHERSIVVTAMNPSGRPTVEYTVTANANTVKYATHIANFT